MIRHHSLSASRGLVAGLDVMTAALVVISVMQAPGSALWPAALVASVFSMVYVRGRVSVRVHERPIDSPRGRWWPDSAYVVALVLVWTALLWWSPAALWLAFPLMLLEMHVLGPHRGVVAVAVTTSIAIAHGLLEQVGDDESWTAFVLGPMLGALVATGVVLGIEAFVRESQERQRTVEALSQVRKDLARTESERAVTAERARLAREIHDTLAQSLSAIDLLLRAADDTVGTDDQKARELVARARDAARASLADARRVVQDLTPPELDGTTLAKALRRVAASTVRTYNDSEAGRRRPLDVSIETNGEPRRLPIAIEAALLRIAQSSLANVAEHAAATRAHLTLTYEATTVTLDVLDDGKGFEPSQLMEPSSARGFGIPAIRSRSDELGGTFALESHPDTGTAVAVSLPVPMAEVGP